VLCILSWNLSNALNWNSTGSHDLLLPLKLRKEDRAGDPVAGNISLHLLFQNIRSRSGITCSMDLNTACAKELDRLFDARISGPLSGKSSFVSDLISFSNNYGGKLAFIDLFGHRICLAEDRCTNQMRSRIGPFEETCIRCSGQPAKELNLRTLGDQPRKPRRGEGRGTRAVRSLLPSGSSCGQAPRALPFPSWGRLSENIPLEPPRKRKGDVFTLRLPYPCSQRPKKRELSPAAKVPPPPQRLVAPVPWNLTPAYFQGNQ
jgi:hypothetical protein